ncbi:MAG TPA: type II toxin-antitoxin system VapC family toxin [Qipengyuania sp.]|nr:type II toxin-antitoxin system VapC family toxin [Qipengyuania sp.]
MILDSNILIEIIQDPGSREAKWLGLAQASQPMRCNPVIVAEIAANFTSLDHLTSFLRTFPLCNEPLSDRDCFRAGQAYLEYKRRGGARETILPDFLIGGQAAERGWTLVTRDRKGFESYFPDLTILDPLKDHA